MKTTLSASSFSTVKWMLFVAPEPPLLTVMAWLILTSCVERSILRSMLVRVRSGLAESREAAKGIAAPRSTTARTDTLIILVEFNNHSE